MRLRTEEAVALPPAPFGVLAARRTADRPLPFATVVVHDSLEAAAEPWARLLAVASVSPYQRWDWIQAWMETEGRASGTIPFIVVGVSARGEPLVLLPLGIVRRRGLRRAVFLGGRETNYNMGLFAPHLNWTSQDVEQLLAQAARAVRGGVDSFALVHQPESWGGLPNPMAHLGRTQLSPSASHSARLELDGEAFLKAHQSAAARKKLRSKASYLATLGPVSHLVARTPAEITSVVDAHVAQKAAKMALIGVGAPDTAALRRLLLQASLPESGGAAPLELHALACGERIVATFGGVAHAGRFSGLLISYDLEPSYARASPGELLLTAVIRSKCAQGFTGFDLGVGEARYKESICPIEDRLFDSFLPLTVAGHLSATAGAAIRRAKSSIKRSPRIWARVQAARRLAARLRRPGA